MFTVSSDWRWKNSCVVFIDSGFVHEIIRQVKVLGFSLVGFPSYLLYVWKNILNWICDTFALSETFWDDSLSCSAKFFNKITSTLFLWEKMLKVWRRDKKSNIWWPLMMSTDKSLKKEAAFLFIPAWYFEDVLGSYSNARCCFHPSKEDSEVLNYSCCFSIVRVLCLWLTIRTHEFY